MSLEASRTGRASDGTSADSWPKDELSQLWTAGAPERHTRLDDLFRQRLHAHDLAGCQALFDVVATAGGEGDPLLSLCRGIVAADMTRDWGAAEAYFHEVLEHPELPPSLHARALMELGLLDRLQGRYREALRHFAESREAAESAGDATTLANALMNMGVVYTEGWMQGQLARSALDEALACQLRSKDIWQQRGERERELRVWNNMGATYKEMGRLDEALAAYRAALALTPPEQRYVRNAITHNIAEVEELLGRWAEAQAAYEQVLATYREIAGDYEVAGALLNLGSVQERRGLDEAAVVSYREAIAAVESLRARLQAEEARAGFLGTRLAPYERLVALSLRRPGEEHLAFEMVERAKARAFIELLADRPVRPPQAVPARLLERERSLRRALSHLYQMRARAGTGDPLARRVSNLEAELEEVYRQMRRLDAQYAGCRTVDPLPLDQVQHRLAPGAALLEYFETGGELGCFVITRTSVTPRMLPGALEMLRRHLTSLPQPPGLTPGAGPKPDQGTGDLYSSLLAPIADLLDGYEDLYVVPHGPLHYLPLHALGAEEPLLRHHRVIYAPSASILLGSEQDGESDDWMDPACCLALGFDDASLHYAELEARHVAAVTGGMARTGAEATAEALYRDGAACRTLHLACHGVFNAEAPLASGLLLADGKLDAMTILQGPRLHAALVVLSACDTGQAAVLRGDELMGLARAILYAGAEAVLVSLWPIDDLATALLMDAFYRAYAHLPKNPTGAAEALRRAQLDVRSMPVEEALAACERLRIAATSQGEALDLWKDASLAYLHAVAGDEVAVRQLAASARGVLPSEQAVAFETRLMRSATLRTPASRKPYAHPYYWAAFVLICRCAPAGSAPA